MVLKIEEHRETSQKSIGNHAPLVIQSVFNCDLVVMFDGGWV